MNRINFPVCGNAELLPLIEMTGVPVHCNVLWESRAAALNAPIGDMRLAYSPTCGHTYNLAFDPSLMEYTQEYENSLHFSPRFQQYATGLAESLVERYDLRNKDIVEIGAGKGDFLVMLAEAGGNRGWGFDPSYVEDPAHAASNVNFVLDFYTEQYADYPADFIVCRHVLEHIPDPDAFVAQVRRAVGDRMGTVVFFEVPNSLWTLRQLGIWDIIYEHCSYFSPVSLGHVFRANGFRVLDVNEVFGGQFLTIAAVPDDGTAAAPDESSALAALTADARAFAANFSQKRAEWQRRLAALSAGGKRGVAWGAGSKGVTFLNVMQASETVPYIVDINPRKQGKFVPGTGQRIVAPDFLAEFQPDFVVVMNANYIDEIGDMLAAQGEAAELLAA